MLCFHLMHMDNEDNQMKLQKLYSLVRKALNDYDMIEQGDRIAIGISGGKDSLALLYALAGIRHFYQVPFEICAVTVDLGWKDFSLEPIQKLCDELKVDYHIIKTDIAQIVFEERKEELIKLGKEKGKRFWITESFICEKLRCFTTGISISEV